MQKQTLHAAVITKEDRNLILSVKDENGQPGSIYWPIHLAPKDIQTGEEFYITLSPEKAKELKENKASEETLRNLLFELIN